jgi:hypothetical protein
MHTEASRAIQAPSDHFSATFKRFLALARGPLIDYVMA